MSRPPLRRLLALLLLAAALIWPVVPPSAAVTRGDRPGVGAAVPAVGACRDFDHGTACGACLVVSCTVPSALLPASLPDRTDAGGTAAFPPADERGHDHVPGISTPPPKTLPRA